MLNIHIIDLKIWFLKHSQYSVKTSKNKPSGKNMLEKKMKNGLKYMCIENSLSEQDLIGLCRKRPKGPLF